MNNKLLIQGIQHLLFEPDTKSNILRTPENVIRVFVRSGKAQKIAIQNPLSVMYPQRQNNRFNLSVAQPQTVYINENFIDDLILLFTKSLEVADPINYGNINLSYSVDRNGAFLNSPRLWWEEEKHVAN